MGPILIMYLFYPCLPYLLPGTCSRPSPAPVQDSTDLGLLMSFMSAIIHDYEHRGVNSDFLIKSHDDLAVLYNDHSPMENHHLASAFALMKDDSYDFLKGLQPKLRTNLRKQVIDMVLATDMKQVESCHNM